MCVVKIDGSLVNRYYRDIRPLKLYCFSLLFTDLITEPRDVASVNLSPKASAGQHTVVFRMVFIISLHTELDTAVHTE